VGVSGSKWRGGGMREKGGVAKSAAAADIAHGAWRIGAQRRPGSYAAWLSWLQLGALLAAAQPRTRGGSVAHVHPCW